MHKIVLLFDNIFNIDYERYFKNNQLYFKICIINNITKTKKNNTYINNNVLLDLGNTEFIYGDSIDFSICKNILSDTNYICHQSNLHKIISELHSFEHTILLIEFLNNTKQLILKPTNKIFAEIDKIHNYINNFSTNDHIHNNIINELTEYQQKQYCDKKFYMSPYYKDTLILNIIDKLFNYKFIISCSTENYSNCISILLYSNFDNNIRPSYNDKFSILFNIDIIDFDTLPINIYVWYCILRF